MQTRRNAGQSIRLRHCPTEPQFLFWLQEARSRVFVVATANDVSRLPPELLRRGRFDELFFVDLPTPDERREIIEIYVQRGLKRQQPTQLLDELVNLSEGFAGSDIESAVREVVKEAYLRGDAAVSPELFRSSFENVVPLTKRRRSRLKASAHGDGSARFPHPGNRSAAVPHQQRRDASS